MMAVHDDSRRVAPGDCFVACAAEAAQRSAHIAEARRRGAGRILAPDLGPDIETVAAPRWAYARLHAQACGLAIGFPLIGVTGTDGKTTVVHIAHHLLGAGAARIGTLGWHDGTVLRPGTHTTPPTAAIHDFLSALPATCPGVCMELSSHGLDQERVAALRFDALVWTGLGRDHLDYHGSVEAYLAAKLKAVRLLREAAVVVVRAEDPRAHVVAHAARSMAARVVTLGFEQGMVRLRRGADGTWQIRSTYVDIALPIAMPGDHNAWNAAAAVLAVAATGGGIERACTRLADLPSVPGRLERVADRPAVYIDYAHTPAALEVALRALRATHPHRRLICVFGAGGDRDTGKRAPMGQAVARYADRAVVTNDNPRSEDPLRIIAMVCGTVPVAEKPELWDGERPFLVEPDRGTAIRLAVERAGADGVVLVAGKGHEQEQIIGSQRRPWDDRAAVRALLREDG